MALVALPVVAGASTLAPTVDAVSVTGADLSVNWTLNVTDATSVDAILYDSTGAVVADDSLDPSVTTDTFYSLAAQSGYYVVVTATDAAGTTSSAPSTTADVIEGPAVITGVSGNGGTVSVTWTNTSLDASGVDVVLYDANGNVVATHSLDPSATTDTFANVADAQGYYIVVTAHTPGGDFDSNPSSSFTLAGGLLSTDAAVSISDLSCVDGTVSVSWSTNSPDATGYDVVLLDANGAVVSTSTVDPSVSTYSFTGVADGAGYVVEIVAHTPIGDLTTDSWSFSIAGGQIVQIPVEPPVVLGTGSGEVVDPSTVTVTAMSGGWTIAWSELADASGAGYYVVTDDQGDSCSIGSTGTAGASISCDLTANGDATVVPTGVSVTYYAYMYDFRAENFGSIAPQLASGGATPVAVTKTRTATTRTAPTPQHHVSVAIAELPRTQSSVLLDALAGLGGLLLASALVLSARRRMRSAK